MAESAFDGATGQDYAEGEDGNMSAERKTGCCKIGKKLCELLASGHKLMSVEVLEYK